MCLKTFYSRISQLLVVHVRPTLELERFRSEGLAPRETASFVSPRPSMFIEVERKQNSLFPAEPIIKYFVVPSNSQICFKKHDRPDHVRVEISSCCLPKE